MAESSGSSADARHPERDSRDALTERDRHILDFERRLWRHPGAKEQAIRAEFSLSSARYYQLLNAVIDSPAALVYDPMLVRRLQRVRDARVAARRGVPRASQQRTS